jgi:hypothetical protein
MAKKARDLDTPFRRGEKVLTTRDVQDIAEGTKGTVKLTNGLGEWRRYWVRFDDGIRGQVSHEDLVRPSQLEAWLQRQEDQANAALASAQAAAEEASGDAAADGGGGDGGGVASLIPAHLLERSQAAKARLLG